MLRGPAWAFPRMTRPATHTEALPERLIRRYSTFAGRRPYATLAVLLPLIGLAGWYGSGIQIRSNMEDLFPENTPAVQAAKRARQTLKAVHQLQVVFGSPARNQNRALALAFCARIEKWPEVAAVDCKHDIEFFRRNALLFVSKDELERIDQRAEKAVAEAAERALVDDALTEGLEPPEPATAVDAADPATREWALPTDADIQKRFAVHDIREWVEGPDGTVLGIKVFPTIDPAQLDQSAAFHHKVEALLQELDPPHWHPQMVVSLSGDYADMNQEVASIKGGLFLTSAAALAIIAFIQVLHFRRIRALLLMSVPLLAGTALTLAFARASIGYLNMITAFIFSMLFGMGNDFNVYTLSRYLEERAGGKEPLEAVVEMEVALLRALNQAALTTSVAFFSLTILDFRGFSQFGLLAGVGVEIALLCALMLFPPLCLALHQWKPDRNVSLRQAQGMRWLGIFARPATARLTIAGVTVLAIAGFWVASGYSFETDLRKLRTPPAKTKDATAASAAHQLSSKYRTVAETRTDSPVLVVTDDIDHARAVHMQLEERRATLTRVKHFVSIHTFVPDDQERKAAIVRRIRQRILNKIELLHGEDRVQAQRALDLLRAEPFRPIDLPEFVRKRFLDTDGGLGRFVLIYPNGNLASASSVQQVVDQVGRFEVQGRYYDATASYFILAEADRIVRKEGPLAVILTAVAVLAVIAWHFRNLWLTFYSGLCLTLAFAVFLGLARSIGLELNMFSVTTLPGILGIAIDGTTHILHRWWEEGKGADLKLILQQVGGAAWVALVTTSVGFAALLFQDNRGLQSIAWMSTIGLLTVALVSNGFAGALLAVLPPKKNSD
jgi:predicted RND superfamily exporter protein